MVITLVTILTCTRLGPSYKKERHNTKIITYTRYFEVDDKK